MSLKSFLYTFVRRLEAVTDKRKQGSDREIVGIWQSHQVSCLDCVSHERIEKAIETDKIRLKDVVDGDLNICDICGKPLI